MYGSVGSRVRWWQVRRCLRLLSLSVRVLRMLLTVWR